MLRLAHPAGIAIPDRCTGGPAGLEAVLALLDTVAESVLAEGGAG
ncbi:MAG: hypothetical protein AAFP17_11420 [Pseudomonadota bacterium]